MNRIKQKWPAVVASCVVFATPTIGSAQAPDQSAAPAVVQAAQQTPEQLQQLVAPIALYPDALVAQILAAATYPDEVVQADRWMQQHPGLQGDQLGQQVDQQSWDPSVKALTEFPSVLANMDKNLSWTSSLGDAEINQEQDVMTAIQTLRQRAKDAGNLQSNSQEKVSEHGKTIDIEPVDADVVYVPQYDPWLVYGAPIYAWPGWYGYPGLYLDGPGIEFGLGFGMGFFGGFGWGWHHWGSDWHHHHWDFDHHRYVSHSRTFVNRNYYANRAHGFGNRGEAFHGGGFHGGVPGGPIRGANPGGPIRGAVPGGPIRGAVPGGPIRGPGTMPGEHGGHPSAFGGIQHGGMTRGFSSAGRSSFGGGFHGGGGVHGGGGHR
jgi:hypothetical protein